MLRYAVYVTVNIIFIHVDMHSLDISYIVTLVWPPKLARGLRNRLVARGRKRLCMLALIYYSILQVWRRQVAIEKWLMHVDLLVSFKE